MAKRIFRSEAAGADDGAEVALDECQAGALDRDVGTGSHRDADPRLRERRSVVDAVASHRHPHKTITRYSGHDRRLRAGRPPRDPAIEQCDRYSVVFFHHPNLDAWVEPSRSDANGVSARDHVLRRQRRSYTAN